MQALLLGLAKSIYQQVRGIGTDVQMLTLTQYIKYTIALVVAKGTQEAGLY